MFFPSAAFPLGQQGRNRSACHKDSLMIIICMYWAPAVCWPWAEHSACHPEPTETLSGKWHHSSLRKWDHRSHHLLSGRWMVNGRPGGGLPVLWALILCFIRYRTLPIIFEFLLVQESLCVSKWSPKWWWVSPLCVTVILLIVSPLHGTDILLVSLKYDPGSSSSGVELIYQWPVFQGLQWVFILFYVLIPRIQGKIRTSRE